MHIPDGVLCASSPYGFGLACYSASDGTCRVHCRAAASRPVGRVLCSLSARECGAPRRKVSEPALLADIGQRAHASAFHAWGVQLLDGKALSGIAWSLY